jgi:micrococcal nuclease
MAPRKRSKVISGISGLGSICIICICIAGAMNTLGLLPDKTPTTVAQVIPTSTRSPKIPKVTPKETIAPAITIEDANRSFTLFLPHTEAHIATVAIPPVEGSTCIPTNTEIAQGQVTQVIDGDTIEVDIAGNTYRVRYIGMDTPENTSQVEYFGPEATQKNRQLVEGRNVILVKDVSEKDRYGRLLRYVIADDVFVNYQLVRKGFATVSTYPPDVSCEATFRQAQQEASNASIGLWVAPTEKPARKITGGGGGNGGSGQRSGGGSGAVPPSGGNCDPSYPTVCIPPSPPDLDCPQIPSSDFRVLPPDPHRFDRDRDGIGCES